MDPTFYAACFSQLRDMLSHFPAIQEPQRARCALRDRTTAQQVDERYLAGCRKASPGLKHAGASACTLCPAGTYYGSTGVSLGGFAFVCCKIAKIRMLLVQLTED